MADSLHIYTSPLHLHHHLHHNPTKLNNLFTVKSSQQSPPPTNLTTTTTTPPNNKNYIWVNPNSPRSSHFRKHSYDSRYSSLIVLSHLLDSTSSSAVSVALSSFGGTLLEQDAVIVINHMTNPTSAVSILKYFQTHIKLSREVVLYNVTLKVMRKKRDFSGARQVFDEMLQRGVHPDNVTFSTLISCARLCGLPDKAVELFESMPAFGCSPDDVTYSAMIDAYGRAGNVDRALGLYDRARTEKWRVDAVTFSTLIRIYGKSGNFDGCLNVYEEMKALGVKPNLVTYNTLLDAMGRAKRPWQAKNVYKEMTDIGVVPGRGTYVALLRAFCRSRYGQDAMKVYNEMKEKGLALDVILYNTLLAMCADVGFADEAVEMYEEMKSSENCKPDSWTFSSMITIFSCIGKVADAEAVLDEMVEAGFEANIFVLTSLIQCYGKANRTDDVVRTFDRVLELEITPDDRFCGCLLSVMTQTPKEELIKLIECVDKANPKLGSLVKLLLEGQSAEGSFKGAALEIFNTISSDVKKAYCNCLIDLCVNLNLLDRACELLDIGLTTRIYTDIQSRTSTQWSLHLKSLSLGAAVTSLHVWMNDIKKAVEAGEELPPILGINSGHGKHKYSEKGLASMLEAHLKELNAPFHEDQDKVGWFLTTKSAAESWLESQKTPEPVSG